MKFTEIYGTVIKFWPEEIIINDNGVPISVNAGHFFPSLTKAWDFVEETVGNQNPWLDLMVWTLFQQFHSEAKKAILSGKGTLMTRDVSLKKIETKYFENLHAEDWKKYLKDYERDI
jgi:hypothetical protein